jgi:hypothetical protein
MPNLYDITFNNRAIDIASPDKRGPNHIALLQALLSVLQWCRDLIFGSYKVGATAPAWVSAPYSQYSMVTYKNAVYYSLISSNTSTPGTDGNWLLIQNNFIGVDERILYNGTKLILEYALNRWFKTVFRQPGGSNSDIYLTTNSTPVGIFVAGLTSRNSSSVYTHTSSEFVINGFSFAASYGLTVNIPIAVYNALAATNTDRDKVVRNFVNKYVTTGVSYNIITY